MFRRAKAVCNRPQSRALYTNARTGNFNCRQQGILIVANHRITAHGQRTVAEGRWEDA